MVVILALLVAAGFGITTVLFRLGGENIRAATGTWISLLASILAVILVTLITDLHHLLSVSLVAVGWFAVAGLLNFTAGRFFIFQSVKHIGASRAAPVYSTAPFFSIVLAVGLTGERITIPLLLGAIAIFVGLYLVVSAEG